MAMEYGGFAGQLRRWRALRRMSQLDVAIQADTKQQPAAHPPSGWRRATSAVAPHRPAGSKSTRDHH
jgi:hypothetical protein